MSRDSRIYKAIFSTRNQSIYCPKLLYLFARPQERQNYTLFLQLSNTGIFRALPDSADVEPKTLKNRLQPWIGKHYPNFHPIHP